MSTTSVDSEFEGSGSEGALDRLARALEERNDHIGRLITEVAASTKEVRFLRTAVDIRPTRSEVAHRRRVTAAGLAFFVLFVVSIGDQHVENCGPGFRAEAVLDAALVDTRADSPERTAALRKIAATAPGGGCDALFPFHTHLRTEDWPTDNNVAGLVLYGIAVTLTAAWTVGPRRRDEHQEATAAEGERIP